MTTSSKNNRVFEFRKVQNKYTVLGRFVLENIGSIILTGTQKSYRGRTKYQCKNIIQPAVVLKSEQGTLELSFVHYTGRTDEILKNWCCESLMSNLQKYLYFIKLTKTVVTNYILHKNHVHQT